MASASDLARPGSALAQYQAARNRATAITAALIAVCVLVGLAACAIMSRLAYRRRFSLLWCFRRHRRVEDDLGFVFIEYDDSTWGTPAKEVWREMPSFEIGTRETQGGELHERLVPPGPLIPKIEVNPIPTIPALLIKPSPDSSRSQSHLPFTSTETGSCQESDTIIETGQDPSDVVPTQGCLHEKTEMSNVPGLAIEREDNVELGMLASPQLAAALALRTGDMDDIIEESELTIADSLASDSAACGFSTESSGSEEDYEFQRVETHSMDFKRGIVVSLGALPDTDYDEDGKKSSLDLYNLPRVVISASPSVASEGFSSRSNRASGISEATIDLGDFPRPPFIDDTLANKSTSLITEIETSLGPIISRSLGMTGRRASSAPQLTSKS